MDGCTAINFVKYVKIGFVQVGVVCAAWWHLRELSQQSNNKCIRTALCTMTKLGWRQFWHALQKWLLSSHPWPNKNDQYIIWKKNIMLSSTDNNFMICIFDFERFSIESRFPFFFNSHVYLGPTTSSMLTRNLEQKYYGFFSDCRNIP